MNIHEIITYLLAIIGIALSVIFYLKSIRTKRLYYYIESINIKPEKEDDYASKFKRYPLKIKETYLTFWNASTEPLSMKDFPSSEKPRICFSSNIQVIESKLVTRNESSNRIKIKKINNKTKDNTTEIRIDFEYINKRQGALIKIIHDGSENDIELNGKIIGNGKVKKVRGNPFKHSINALLLINLTFIMGTITFYQFWSHLTNSFFVGVIAGTVSIVLLIHANYSHVTSVSKDLRGLYDDFRWL